MSSEALQQQIVSTLKSQPIRGALKGLDEMNSNELRDHIYSTYNSLRMGLVIISLAFPLFLWFIGWFWYNIPLQNSMSAYYFAESHSQGPIRSLLANIDIFPINY